eukprot:6192111-Pleurochrysis_carterae.AAC.4
MGTARVSYGSDSRLDLRGPCFMMSNCRTDWTTTVHIDNVRPTWYEYDWLQLVLGRARGHLKIAWPAERYEFGVVEARVIFTWSLVRVQRVFCNFNLLAEELINHR